MQIKSLIICSLMLLPAASQQPRRPDLNVGGQNRSSIDLNEVYRDESHCLVGPEIRGEGDRPISCYCRDVIADLRYIHQTYLLPDKDRNLYGAYLGLEIWAGKLCGDGYNVNQAVEQMRWNGPKYSEPIRPIVRLSGCSQTPMDSAT
jgi:hypothetical protein